MPSTDPSSRNDNKSAPNNSNHDDNDDNETTLLTTKQARRKPQWFGSAVTDANQGAAGLPPYPFPPPLQNAMAHHLEKAATRRAQALDAITTDSTSSMMLIQDYLQSPLSKEGYFGFDTQEYPLREAFQTAIGLSPELELTSIHRQPPGKLHLLQYLTRHYAPFQEVYDEFVRRVCCPHLAALYDQNNTTNLDVIYYQCFPCVRMITPGEFSIGPHADISYGHHPMTTNFYVLLTDLVANESSAALFLESRMGAQDWHPIVGRYGAMVKHFAGALCAHWTTDNCTANTRVSLDFRLLPGPLYHSVETQPHNVYREKEGYYSQCRRGVGRDGEWERMGPLQVPDARVGFPWTVSNWDKLLKKEEKKTSSAG